MFVHHNGRLYSQRNQINEIGRGEIAVVSYGFWRKRLHSNVHAIGQPIELNSRLYTVTGLLPADYRSVYGHGVCPEVYISDTGNGNTGDRVYQLFIRMRDGFSREPTRKPLRAALVRLGNAAEPRNLQLRPMSGWSADAAGAQDERRFFLFFAMLFVVAGTLALIACSNVAGLLLVRVLNRRREQAICKAIGANIFKLRCPCSWMDSCW